MASVLKSLLHEKDKDNPNHNDHGDSDTGVASGSEDYKSAAKKKSKSHQQKPKQKAPYKKRDRSKSTYSIISLSEVTEGALQIWRNLPEKIRQDPSLASFRQENERIHGKLHF